jgi:hypothetical protein
MYADDTQAYISFQPGVTEAEALKLLQDCIHEVRCWMAANFLKVNEDKTEFIVLGSKHNLKKVQSSSIKISDCTVTLRENVKNIGATFDSSMKMEDQVTKTCKSAWFNLYKISKIHRYLTADQAKSALHAYVTSRLDQNNSLLIGLPKNQIKKLSRVQHAAARLLVGAKKHDEIAPILKTLHWLPIQFRIKFKILLFTYKALNDQGPAYIKDLLIQYHPARCLRSANENLLVEPRSKSSYGDRAFSIVAPKLWNCLPSTLKDITSLTHFKTALKTHLFRQSFPQ